MRSVRLLEMFSKLIYSFGFLSRELRTQFFIGLAALFSLFTILYFIDAFLGGKTEQSLDYDTGSLDFAMDWRLSSPDANHDIVIIDIDERSLAIMAEEYGRWPWPRAVIADFWRCCPKANRLPLASMSCIAIQIFRIWKEIKFSMR